MTLSKVYLSNNISSSLNTDNPEATFFTKAQHILELNNPLSFFLFNNKIFTTHFLNNIYLNFQSLVQISFSPFLSTSYHPITLCTHTLPSNLIAENLTIRKDTHLVPGDSPNSNSSRPPFLDKTIHSAAFLHLTSGALAGAFSRTATAPLDRIKVMMQVSQTTHHTQKITLRSIICSIVNEPRGLLAFFRGNGTNCLKVAPETATKFFAYDLFKNQIYKYKFASSERSLNASSSTILSKNTVNENVHTFVTNPPSDNSSKPISPATLNLTFPEKLISGAAAGFCAQFTIYPMEVIKTRLALCPSGLYTGISHCFKTIYYQEGFFTLYRGVLPAMLGILPYAGIDLAAFETFKSLWASRNPYEPPNPPIYLLLTFGAISSTLGQLVSYPISLIRTRLQVDGMNNTQRIYNSATEVFIKIIKNEGPLTLYRGMGPSLMKTVPAVSISWVVYETSKKHISSLTS